MNENRNTTRFAYFTSMVLLAIMLLALGVQLNLFPRVDAAPAVVDAPVVSVAPRYAFEGRVDGECFSPKYEYGRVQGTLVVVIDSGDKGYRHAGCGETPAPVEIVAPVVVVPAAPVCVPLFTSVDTPPALGGVVTSQGEWVVEVRDGVTMLANGKSFTVTFPQDIVIMQVAVFDNDPKVGEMGASLNGVSLPITDNSGWATLYPSTITNTITFDHGQDSAHIAICVGE